MVLLQSPGHARPLRGGPSEYCCHKAVLRKRIHPGRARCDTATLAPLSGPLPFHVEPHWERLNTQQNAKLTKRVKPAEECRHWETFGMLQDCML